MLANITGFKFSKQSGKLYENAVFLKLKQEFINAPSTKIYYWKNILHEEVDFVVTEGRIVKQLIQVCFDIENPETKKRELRALLKASKELRCKNLLIITKEYENEEKINKTAVKYIPL